MPAVPSAALQPRSALFAICRFTRHVSIRAVKLVGGCKFGSEQTKRAEARRSDSTGSFEEAQVVMSSRPSLLVVLVLLFPEAPDACLSFGCFGGFGCAPPCPMGLCLPMCIGGGCLAARARAAKTYHDEGGVEQSATTQEPNEHFTTCCSVLGVPQSCLQMCTFDGYNMTVAQSSLAFGIPCPATALPQIQFCAARGADHSDCCRAAGVSSQCLVFCDQSPDHSNQVALSHLQCLERFDSMKDCFVEHALTEYYRGKQAALDQTHKSHLT